MVNIITHQPFSDPAMEALLGEFEQQNVVWQLAGKNDALAHIHRTLPEHHITVVTPITASGQKILDENYSRSEIKSDLAQTQSVRSDSTEKIHLLKTEQVDREKQLTVFDGQLKTLKSGLKSIRNQRFKKLGAGGAALCEGILFFDMLYGTMQVLSVIAFSVAATLACLIGISAAATFIMAGKTEREKMHRFIVMMMIAVAVSIPLAFWRVNTYAETASINAALGGENHSTPSTSPSLYFLLTVIAVATGISLECKFWMSEKDKRLLKAYEDKDSEAKQFQSKYNEVAQEITRLERARTAASTDTIRKFEYRKSVEQRVLSIALHHINQYESAYLQYKADAHFPEYFGTTKDLPFTFYFQNNFTQQNPS